MTAQPSLPPELIHDILSYLCVPPHTTFKDPRALDLVSCSLVNKVWHDAAQPLLPPNLFGYLDLKRNDPPPLHLNRLSSLLHESFRLGVPLAPPEMSLGLKLDTLYPWEGNPPRWPDSQAYEDAWIRVLMASHPRALSLRMGMRFGVSKAEPFLKKWFEHIAPFCGRVQRLKMCGFWFTGPIKMGFGGLDEFVKKLAGRLREVEHDAVGMTEGMAEALRMCIEEGATCIELAKL
ncbi:hypothetical protein BC938DRAFT_474501 [Jimgerdemannia flammicorona]|uniref:F-box domain-containing protein n=1 Tax=Jimgerdemannia flammicorona TaxID=994334 RepID=A0A433Q221_9FUNG|nr:hypothetical protein BC938DRAFT_474501 [Jimgerdemannia flammicorona]